MNTKELIEDAKAAGFVTEVTWHEFKTKIAKFAALRDQRRQGVPDGWKLVPVEPTQAMCQAGQNKASEWPKFPLRINPIYQAMLSAALSPEMRQAVPDGWNLYVTNGDMGPFIHIKAPDGRGAGEALHSSGFGSLVEEMLAAPPADTVEQNHVIDGVCPKHNVGGGPCYCYPLRPVARIADDEGSGVPE
jgi:hypothetical protein